MWHGVCPMNKIVNYTVLKFQTKKINTNLYKWCHSSTSRCRCYTFPSLNAAESRSVRPTPTVRAGRDNSRRCSPPLLRGKLHRIKVRLRINNRTRRIMRSACFVHRRRRKTPTVCTPKIMAIKKLFPMKNRVRATPPPLDIVWKHRARHCGDRALTHLHTRRAPPFFLALDNVTRMWRNKSKITRKDTHGRYPYARIVYILSHLIHGTMDERPFEWNRRRHDRPPLGTENWSRKMAAAERA